MPHSSYIDPGMTGYISRYQLFVAIPGSLACITPLIFTLASEVLDDPHPLHVHMTPSWQLEVLVPDDVRLQKNSAAGIAPHMYKLVTLVFSDGSKLPAGVAVPARYIE